MSSTILGLRASRVCTLLRPSTSLIQSSTRRTAATFAAAPRRQPTSKPFKPPNGAARIKPPAFAGASTIMGESARAKNHRGPEQVNRSVRRKITTAMILFGTAMVINAVWLQPYLNNDAPKGSADAFKGVNVIIKEATVGGDAVDTVDSGTSSVGPLPTRIFLPMSSTGESQVLEEYTLVGHGIRTVSFLSIQVYVVALYVATSSLPPLQRALLSALDIPSNASTATLPERNILRQKILDEQESVKLVDGILSLKGENGVKMALRIVPTRKTDFQHLRDGWVRGLTAKTKLHPELYDDEEFVEALGKFKQIFGAKSSVGKGEVLILARDQNGVLTAYGPDEGARSQDKVVALAEGGKKETAMHGLKGLGEVNDERVSRALWLTYWAGKTVASEPARRSVAEGMVGIVERPVGSTEGKVV